MNTATSMLGIPLPHPFVAGASPLGWSLDTVKRLEDAGAAAIVLPSLFEEQVTVAEQGRLRNKDPLDPRWADTLKSFPAADDYPLAPAEYAEHLMRAKQSVRIPVLASLNGTTAESWLKCARTLEQAGADALELNLYQVVADLAQSSAAVEHQLVTVVTELKRFISLPIAVKLSPFFAAFGNLARQLDRAGADGLVMFNRFYQPDIDTATMRAVPRVELSTSEELRLRLRWTAILHGRVRPSLIVTGGVATPDDGIKALLAGADAMQLASALLRHGPEYLTTMTAGLVQWMEQQGLERLDEVRGRVSLKTSTEPAAFERGNYIHALQNWPRGSARS